MRKGFLLGGPVVKKAEETKKDEQKKQTAPAADKPSPAVVAKPSAGAVVPGKRRRRTRSLGASLSPSPGRGFFVPGYQAGAASPSAMSLTELMDASRGTRGLTNMALAHEIAVDKNFQLTKIQPENELEKQIKDVMQRAFWDILSEQLAAEPPVYTQALQLFTEVKAMLYSILLPQHEAEGEDREHPGPGGDPAAD